MKNYTKWIFLAFCTCAINFTLGATTSTTQSADPGPTANFDHTADGKAIKTATVNVDPGKAFTVKINNTCKDVFKVTVDGVENEEAATAEQAAAQQSAQAQRAVQAATNDVASRTLDLAQSQSELEQTRTSLSAAEALKSSPKLADASSAAAEVESLSLPPSMSSSLSTQLRNAKSMASRKSAVTEQISQLNQIKSNQLVKISAAYSNLQSAQENLRRAVANQSNPPPPAPCDAKDSIPTTVVYNAKNGAYEAAITRIDGKTDPVAAKDSTGKDITLYPTTDIVVTPSSPWSTFYSAGVVISSLTNPKYSLQPGATGSTTYTVVRDKSSEDKVSAGLAAFVTVSHRDWIYCNGKVQLGATFGIGTTTASKIEYYPGISMQTGSLLITAGPNIGSVDSLPSGLKEGGTTTQANALSTLSSRTAVGAFISFSWTFLGGNAQTSFSSALTPVPAKAK